MTHRRWKQLAAGAIPAIILLAASACNGGGAAGTGAMPAGRGAASSASGYAPDEERRGFGASAIGDSCRAGYAGRLCLGLKYVVYHKPDGEEGLTREDAVAGVRTVNRIWNACDIGFEIEDFEAVDPGEYGLAYNTSTYGELDDIRSAFGDDHTLLIVTTGTWNRGGGLGDSGANAWTAMPGAGPFGTVLELPVGKFANIVAHELGHYLNLLHVDDASDLMNPVIYSTSGLLGKSQCETARSAASGYWRKMLR